jgi:tol-pal system protein YbgF
MSPIKTRVFLLSAAALALGGAVAVAPPAYAQRDDDYPQQAVPPPDGSEVIANRGIERRLERDEKDLRDLRRIVLQARAQGAPVEVKDAGPDPQVDALQQRIGDLEETLRRQTGQMESLAHDAQMASRSARDANDANRTLLARIDALERQMQAMSAAAPPPPLDGQGSQYQGQSQGSGVLGTLRGADAQGFGRRPPSQPQAGPDDEPQAYRAARRVLDDGDYVGGAAALQDYLDRYPNSPRAPEANYWLGRTLALRHMHDEAVHAYAHALNGWPATSWAGDAVVGLAASLIQQQRAPEACKALAEFDRRYKLHATPTVKARARDARAAASCGGRD